MNVHDSMVVRYSADLENETNDLDELGCQEELLQEYAQRKDSHPLDFVRKYLHRDWDVRGYLFRATCPYCKAIPEEAIKKAFLKKGF